MRRIAGGAGGFSGGGRGGRSDCQFGDRRLMARWREVFFGSGANPLGHSYAHLMRGPEGRDDLADVYFLPPRRT